VGPAKRRSGRPGTASSRGRGRGRGRGHLASCRMPSLGRTVSRAPPPSTGFSILPRGSRPASVLTQPSARPAPGLRT
jgi:hypothetical protein